MMPPPYLHWDEYQWDDEIRRHESIVAHFFQDLVYCLDLPMDELPESWGAETEIPSDPVAARRTDALRRWMSDHEDEEESANDPPDSDLRNPVSFSCVEYLDQLAARWNSFAILNLSGNMNTALAINCTFAKLLARVADFTDPAKNVPRTLQITLGKRAIFDLEELVDRLKECQAQLAQECQTEYFISRLAILRDQLIECLSGLR